MSNKSDAVSFIYWHHLHAHGPEYEKRILDSYMWSKYCCDANEKAIIRKQYNPIPHPLPDTKRERNMYNKDGIK